MRELQASFLRRPVRVFALFLFFLFTIFLSFSLPAQEVSADDWQDASEDILKYVAENYQSEYGSSPENMNIAYGDTGKIYVDVDLFAGNSSTYSEIENLCKNAPVVYSVPVESDGSVAVVEVSRGLPLDESSPDLLTEEEKQRIVENEGKWTPVSVFFTKNYRSLDQQTRDILNQNDFSADTPCILLGGIPGIHQVMIAADVSPDCVFLPLDSTSLTETDSSSDSDPANRQAETDFRETYSFAELRKIAESNKSEENKAETWERREKNNNIIGIVVPVLCIAGIGSVAAFLYLRKKKQIS